MSALVCLDCGQRYKRNAGHCRGGRYEGCCSSFDTTAGFDAHRTGGYAVPGERRCLTPEERIALGWTQTPTGFWRSPRDERNADKIRRRVGGSVPGASEGAGLDLRSTPAVSEALEANR